MKNCYYYLSVIFLLLISSSCQKEHQIVHLENLNISEDLSEYMDYYESNEELRFRKVAIPDGTRPQTMEYWTFYRGIPKSIYHILRPAVKPRVYGKMEERSVVFKDDDGNELTFIARTKAHITNDSENYELIQDQFTIRYSEPCTATYIDYITKAYRENVWEPKKKTILVPSKEVDGVLHHEVIQLETIKEGSHFAFYITKENGIIQIDNLDEGESWVR